MVFPWSLCVSQRTSDFMWMAKGLTLFHEASEAGLPGVERTLSPAMARSWNMTSLP
eukprot:CAMPEP_0206253364 /NCGR_PEP_ID=MMETSP0047_2-20121206/23111_1 /ASSEMBLY_ACC=CAM_ASM_000192 /TAXON_ID=195065 /ORGANISM="Chroomonas mesostigmatica_cf, Strain CCMP1168" /LENGTH=55 /DNA_ID=CAMNT_0053679565 /DNA_START=261 /DNA_END=425 /DNA_ORIENTATION=+